MMHGSWKRSATLMFVALATIALGACGDDDKASDSGDSNSSDSSDTAVVIKATSFGPDFSAMADLKPLVAQGKGKVAVLLPDTTSSARYESFDRPYLEQAFE